MFSYHVRNRVIYASNLMKQLSLNVRSISASKQRDVLRGTQQIIRDTDYSIERNSINNLFDKVNETIAKSNSGRSFALIHLYGCQHLVHYGDIVLVKTAIPADIGEQIKLEKCLIVGNQRFTLIGRPILNRDLVNVTAIILEKTMSATQYNVKHIPRNHGYKRWRFERTPYTMLRINQIDYCHQLNQTQRNVQ